MLKSVYSRIFFLCTIVLMFACGLTGVIMMLYANHEQEQEAYDRFYRTARVLLMRIRDQYVTDEMLQPDTLRTELETYTTIEFVDCYVFDSDGVCIVRSDYNATDVSLSAALREEASAAPYCRMGGASGNFSEPTATYVERFELGSNTYYLMLMFPVAYISNFSSSMIVVLAVTVLVIGVLGALMFYFNTMQLLKPVLGITHAAEQYAKGDFSCRLSPTGEPELDKLAATMNRMADFIDKNERSRQRFVSDISHELKTPMTTIGGFVDNILDGTIPPEKQKHYLRIVSSEVQRMTRMVHSMLNISRFEEGTLSPHFEKLDLTNLLIQTLLLFEKRIDEKQVRVEGLDACPRTFCEVDKDLIQQVFYNLTENAIKFVDEGGELFLAVDSDETQAHVHLRNSGEGLAEDEIPHIFERFYKTDISRGKDTTGVGLGLSIVSRIVVLHSGTVTVRSVKDEYTEFIVSLPLTQPQKKGDEA